MVRDQGHVQENVRGHVIESRARILPVVDGVTPMPGGGGRACYASRTSDTDRPFSAVTLSIPVPDGADLSVLAARPSRHPAVFEARAGAPS